jgi:hypothetical protein
MDGHGHPHAFHQLKGGYHPREACFPAQT